MNEVSASNQRSVRKASRHHLASSHHLSSSHNMRMPKITRTGKLAKITKGPAKKIGKEK